MAIGISAIISAVLAAAAPVLDKIIPDVAEREKAKTELQMAMLEQSDRLERAAADIIKTEAASSHWLAANWRPLTALIFVGLIVARWLGWTAPGMSEAEYLSVYEIIKIMIGGYVLSRGVEKIVPNLPFPRHKPER